MISNHVGCLQTSLSVFPDPSFQSQPHIFSRTPSAAFPVFLLLFPVDLTDLPFLTFVPPLIAFPRPYSSWYPCQPNGHPSQGNKLTESNPTPLITPEIQSSQLSSRKPAEVSFSSLTPSPRNHKDLLLQTSYPNSSQYPSLQNIIRHSM